jgi:hypothetical protein
MLTLGTTTTTASPCSTCLINGTSCATACRSSNSYGSMVVLFLLILVVVMFVVVL